MVEKLRLRDPELAKRVVKKILDISPKRGTAKICHVCGTHEWTITHYGLRSLLPSSVEVIAGPGCPVCIVPASEIDEAVQLALRGCVITCFGDLLRVPGSSRSLLDARSEGSDVRVVYSVRDAVNMAQKEPRKQFVFFSVGFETTAPSTAIEISREPPSNMSFLISNRTIPPAMKMLCEMQDLNLDGFVAPGHVSTIIGLEPYGIFPERYSMPVVVAGFEPLDVLFAIYMILKQIKNGKPQLENEYVRAVGLKGNIRAKRFMRKVYETIDGNWRGLGVIPMSKLCLNEPLSSIDAHAVHDLRIDQGADIKKGCRCHLVIVGKINPTECPLFMKTCNAQTPVGACMVSTEGTCRIWATENQP